MAVGEGSMGPRVMGLICAAAAAGAVLTGCGNNNGDGGGTGNNPLPPPLPPLSPSQAAAATGSPTGALTQDQADRKALVARAKVSYDKALRAAVAAVPASKPVSAELEGSDVVGPRWDTQVATSDGTVRSVRVDAVSGKADPPRTETDEDGDDRRKLAGWLKKATVTAEQAARTATDKTKGTVTSIELDDSDDGKLMWSVDVVTPKDWNKTTFDVDATNRKVLREHVDAD